MKIPAALIDRLHAGRVVPFAGAGVSMAVVDRDSHQRLFPNWSELLFAAADRLDHELRVESVADAKRIIDDLGLWIR